MDTTTVNYAIDKISSTWEKIAPQISNVSHEYVNYVVMKQVIETPIVLIFAAGFIWFMFFFIRKFKVWKEEKYDKEIFAIAGGVVCGIIGTILTIVAMFSVYYSILAITCPEMYTINQIISAAVNK